MSSIKIKGSEHWRKDPVSGVIFSTDEKGLQEAKDIKARILSEIDEKERLQARVNKLEDAVTQIMKRLNHESN